VKGIAFFVIGLLCGAVVMALPRVLAHVRGALHNSHRASAPEGSRTHTEERFAFTANGPMDKVAPLFGADRERVWAPGWNPQFLHPVPAADQEGMVFTVAHDHVKAAWVNTLFDLKAGRIQYAYVIPDALVTVIDLKLTPQGSQTRVEVEYDRTALSAEADAHVQHMAEGDRRSGPEWEQQVNAYLSTSNK
jgi:hypothetical protein